MDTDATKKNYVTCPLCEATCGLEITTQGREVISIRGNTQDVFSQGYLCPKAYSLKELHADPDRIRQPMVRDGENWRIVSWQEAFETIERGLSPLSKSMVVMPPLLTGEFQFSQSTRFGLWAGAIAGFGQPE